MGRKETNPMVIEPRAIAWRAGSEMWSVERVFCAIEGKRRDAAPFEMPKRPCRATRMDERGSIMLVDRSGG